MTESSSFPAGIATVPVSRRWRWLLLGILLGGACVALLLGLFLAYGQPGLLLEQMNLRYCG